MFSLSWYDINKHYGRVLGALLTTFILFYLVFHALSGERGLYVLFKEQRHLEQLHKQIDEISSRRKTLEHKAQMLGSGSLDLDLLDEQSRRYLSEAGKDEVMISLPGKDKEKPR